MRRSATFAALALAATSPFALALDSGGSPPVPAGAYTLDKSHTSLIFRVSHIGFSTYTGRFTNSMQSSTSTRRTSPIPAST